MDEQSSNGSDFKNFRTANFQLLTDIQQALDGATKISKKINEWKNPSVWKVTVLPDLKNIIETYQNDVSTLAKFQVALAKYFDFFSLEWATKDAQERIKSRVSEIVDLALQIIMSTPLPTLTLPCDGGQHEDYACCRKQLGPRYNGPDIPYNNWPMLPKADAVNFLSPPLPVLLPLGTRLYRIISPQNNPYGSWWFYNLKFNCKQEWRAKLSVRKIWNSNDYCVDFTINISKLRAWEGTSASQQTSSNCILNSGEKQVWIDPQEVKKIPLPNLKKIIMWPFP